MPRFVTLFLSAIVGCIFLYSAFTKSFPVEPFEYTLAESLHLPWFWAAIGARFLTGLEAGLGLLLMVNLTGSKKWVLKKAFALLIIFSVYITYIWVRFGSKVNCGCFGDAIWMTPLVSLVKNAILLFIIAFLLRFAGTWKWKRSAITAYVVLLMAIALPFILIPMPQGKPDWVKTGGYSIDLSLLRPSGSDTAIADLSKGKHIVAFLSQRCPHCRLAAYKMHVMKQNNPGLPLFMVIAGVKTTDLSGFFKETRAINIPYALADQQLFMSYTAGVYPQILWINNGTVEAKSDYANLDQAAIEQWLMK